MECIVCRLDFVYVHQKCTINLVFNRILISEIMNLKDYKKLEHDNEKINRIHKLVCFNFDICQ